MPIYAKYDDEMLLLLLRQSDEKAFTEIYNRYWRKLYGLAWYHLKSKPQAEDAVQEVLSGLWQRKDILNVQSLSNYLSVALKYSVFRQVAHEKRQAGTLSFATATEYSLAEFHFLQDLVQKEVNRLPEKCRLVFRCSREEGLSNKEIAKKLDISEKTVEKHMTKALKQLRTQLNTLSLFLF